MSYCAGSDFLALLTRSTQQYVYRTRGIIPFNLLRALRGQNTEEPTRRLPWSRMQFKPRQKLRSRNPSPRPRAKPVWTRLGWCGPSVSRAIRASGRTCANSCRGLQTRCPFSTSCRRRSPRPPRLRPWIPQRPSACHMRNRRALIGIGTVVSARMCPTVADANRRRRSCRLRPDATHGPAGRQAFDWRLVAVGRREALLPV
jgi:hypothetical protein